MPMLRSPRLTGGGVNPGQPSDLFAPDLCNDGQQSLSSVQWTLSKWSRCDQPLCCLLKIMPWSFKTQSQRDARDHWFLTPASQHPRQEICR